MTLPKPWLLLVAGGVLVVGFVMGGIVAVAIQVVGGLVVGVGHALSRGWRPSELRGVPARPEPCCCGDVDELAPGCAVHGVEL